MGLWLAGALLLLGATPPAWTPPARPDPSIILREAAADGRAGRYQVALAKHLWYHENALRFDEGQGGVRLSFALSYWMELAHSYPPALVALKRTRDQALKTALANGSRSSSGYQAFHDFVSINEALGDQPRTAEAFTVLAAKDPTFAEIVYSVAQPALVLGKQYEVCGKYLHPETDWAQIVSVNRLNRAYVADGKFGPAFASFAKQSLLSSTANLVALLVLNGRRTDAEKIAKEARLESDDADFLAAVDKALQGVVPESGPE